MKWIAACAVLDAVFLCITGCEGDWTLFALGAIGEIGLAYAAYKYKTHQSDDDSDKRRAGGVRMNKDERGTFFSVGTATINNRQETYTVVNDFQPLGKGALKIPGKLRKGLEPHSLTRTGTAYQGSDRDL